MVEEEGCGAIADLLDEEQGRLKELVDKKLPPKVEGQLKATHLATHYIDVQVHSPIKQRYRVVSPKVQEAMYQEVDRILAEGVVKESFSDWSTSIVMAKKANGGYHLCLDFRKLNAISKKDAYLLPYVSDIPSFLNFGREHLPYRSLRNEVNVKQQPSQLRPTQAKYYDKHRRERLCKVGDLVLERKVSCPIKKRTSWLNYPASFPGPIRWSDVYLSSYSA